MTSRFRHSPLPISEVHPPISNSRPWVRIACLSLLLTAPACAQFASLQLKSLCEANELGAQPFAGLVAGPDDLLYGTTYSGAGTVRGTVFSIHRDGSGFTLLHRFTDTDGADPYSALIVGNDGLLYGTTSLGGTSDEGTVFSIHPSGTGFRILHSFAGTNDAKQPYAGLIQARDGALYGTTQFGGISNQGAIFTLQTDASNCTLLHQFTGIAGDGSQPTAKLIEGSDDALYGTTYFGGNTNLGTVFKLNKDGSAFTILHSFAGTSQDGAHPYAGLLEGPDGMLYGTTIDGGSADGGTVFKLNKNGQDYSVLHTFGTTNDGAQPYSHLLWASDDRLYGTTAFGGITDSGTLFQIAPDGTTYQLLRSFINTNHNPSLPYAALIEDSDGALHGTTWTGGNNDHGALYRLNKDGQDFTVLHSFARGQDAITPYGTLLEASNQILYGTSWSGGSHHQGTIFKLNKNGSQYAILRDLSDSDGDGTLLNAGLIEGTDGSLYGTAVTGGTMDRGAVLAIDKDGAGFRILRNFTGTAGDGFYPYAGLLEASDGALYGTTAYGGSSSRGTIFRMTKTGSDYAILHHFIGTSTDGAHPFAPLIEASDGILYGTTAYGGGNEAGTIFKLNKNGSGFTLLRIFTGTDGDGSIPYSGVIESTDGALLGMTRTGGQHRYGTLFKLNKNGTGYTNLHHFSRTDGDGALPGAGARLIEGLDGALYGTTSFGGIHDQGTAFRITTDGSDYGVIHSFIGTDGTGANPYAGLTLGTDGAFYGTTQNGGLGCGTIFKITPAATLTISREGNLRLAGPAGLRFAIEYLDPDLTSEWITLTNVILATDPSEILDPVSGTSDHRLYRGLLAP